MTNATSTVKVTKVQKFNAIKAILPQYVEIEGVQVDTFAFIDNEIGLIQKKASSKSKKVDRTNEKSIALEILEGGKKSPTEVMAEGGFKSTQFATAILKALADEGKVVKITEGKKVFYTLA